MWFQVVQQAVCPEDSKSHIKQLFFYLNTSWDHYWEELWAMQTNRWPWVEVTYQWDTVLKTGHITQRSLQTAGFLHTFLHTCRHMWAEQAHTMLNQYCQTTFSAKQQFGAYGHVTEYRDESILKLEVLNKVNNQRVYMLVNSSTSVTILTL